LSPHFQTAATKVFSRNGKDIPFALLYSTEDNSSDTASNTTRFSGDNQQCTLRGSVGLPKDSPAGPVHLNFSRDYGFTPYFRQAVTAREPVIVTFEDGSAAAELVRGIQWKGFGDPCKAAAICPLNPTSSEDNILGFLVIGLNPRRPYNDDYHEFILVASRLLSTSLTSILLHEEDIGRRERTIANAEAMKMELRQQLLATQKEVERSALKFKRFAERADVGIFILDMDGIYSYRNQAWFDILAPKDRGIELGEAWNELIDEEYVGLGQAKFETLIKTRQHQYVWEPTRCANKLTLVSRRSFELRLKRKSGNSKLQEEPMWILLSIFPELSDDGEVIEIIGCFTDIRYV
jgi:PAS domain-containing protein